MNISFNKWNSLIKSKKIKECANQSKGFLMFGQLLDVNVIYKNKKYHASAFQCDNTVKLSLI